MTVPSACKAYLKHDLPFEHVHSSEVVLWLVLPVTQEIRVRFPALEFLCAFSFFIHAPDFFSFLKHFSLDLVLVVLTTIFFRIRPYQHRFSSNTEVNAV